MNSIRGNNWSALVPPAGATWTPTRRVSICIPAHNPANLRRVLDAVRLQTYPSSLMEVVIADDGSEPPIRVPGDYPFPVSVLRLERRLAFGAGRARNAAACRASGDLLVFLDADIVPERQVVACYARWFVDRSDVLAMGLCRFADMEELTDEDFRNREKRPEYEQAIEDMLSRTDHGAARWQLVEAESKRYARVKVVETAIAEIERGMRKHGIEPIPVTADPSD